MAAIIQMPFKLLFPMGVQFIITSEREHIGIGVENQEFHNILLFLLAV